MYEILYGTALWISIGAALPRKELQTETYRKIHIKYKNIRTYCTHQSMLVMCIDEWKKMRESSSEREKWSEQVG